MQLRGIRLIGVFFSRTFFEMQAGGEQIIVDYGVDYASICLGLSIGHLQPVLL